MVFGSRRALATKNRFLCSDRLRFQQPRLDFLVYLGYYSLYDKRNKREKREKRDKRWRFRFCPFCEHALLSPSTSNDLRHRTQLIPELIFS